MASKKLPGSANRKSKLERNKVAASLAGRLGDWLKSDKSEEESERKCETSNICL